MNIYIGKLNKSAMLSTHETIFKSDDVLIQSNKTPLLNLDVGNGKLVIWGNIHRLTQGPGKVIKFDPLASMESLKALAHKATIKDLINSLEGHYIGVLVRSAKEVTVFSDIYNRQDIFYVLKGNSLVASTDLDAVVRAYPVQGYNQEALVNMFHVYGNYAPKKHTIYKGIWRLGVGESLVYKESKTAVVRMPFDPVAVGDYKEAQLEEYSNLLHEAVDVRASNECNWVSLSSGWDSSSILALLVKLRGAKKVRAVTGRCKYSNESGVNNQFEADRAKSIADYFNVPLEVVEIDATKPEYVQYWQEISPSLKANHLYSLWSYDHMRLAERVGRNGAASHMYFNGEISDGAHNLGFAQFASILEHPDLNFREYSDKMASYLFGPSFFKRIMENGSYQDFIYNIFKSRMAGATFDDPAKMTLGQRKMEFAASFFISNQRTPYMSRSNSLLLTPSGQKKYAQEMTSTYLADFAKRADAKTVYSWFLHLYNSFHWQGGTVKILPWAADFYGRHVAMPFWDSRLQHFLSAMPEHWGRGLDLNPTKYPLKWTLRNKVNYPHHLQVGPHSYLYDIDPNWSADADVIYGSYGKSYFKELLKKYPYEAVLQESSFNLKYLRKLVNDYCKDKRVVGQQRTDLKNLISLCLVGWY